MHKNKTKGKKEHFTIPFLYTEPTYQLSFWNINLKVDPHAWDKWFIHGLKENQSVALLETPLPIILRLAYKFDNGGPW